jgi:hypothetical protein
MTYESALSVLAHTSLTACQLLLSCVTQYVTHVACALPGLSHMVCGPHDVQCHLPPLLSCSDPVERLKLVVAFAVGGMRQQVSCDKPFNPILVSRRGANDVARGSASIEQQYCWWYRSHLSLQHSFQMVLVNRRGAVNIPSGMDGSGSSRALQLQRYCSLMRSGRTHLLPSRQPQLSEHDWMQNAVDYRPQGSSRPVYCWSREPYRTSATTTPTTTTTPCCACRVRRFRACTRVVVRCVLSRSATTHP